jgi:UDP-3-O-[3-hydroxymyristoyl] N-acetylglucosamine deacetylase
LTSIEGYGLHGGVPSSVRFLREPGGVRLRSSGVEARIAELVFDGAKRSTTATTRDGRLRVGTVEHLFAALGAMSIRDGVVVEIEGPEVPLADGSARAFVDALAALGQGPSPPALRIVRAGTIDVGSSQYEVRPPEHATDVRVEVEVDFDDHRLERHARWNGDAIDFRDRIAPARTFGFEHEVSDLMERGLASHVTPESVVVIARDRVLSAGRPFRSDEPARHKLLDLVGDLYAHGGPPLGSVRATRPGHAATHEAIRHGFARGLLMLTRTR